jgi:hypothetical protein
MAIARFSLTRVLLWPHRLTVRTPGFHPGNRGSIPRGVTNAEKHRALKLQ